MSQQEHFDHIIMEWRPDIGTWITPYTMARDVSGVWCAYMSSRFTHASFTSLLVPQQAVFQVVSVHSFALKLKHTSFLSPKRNFIARPLE